MPSQGTDQLNIAIAAKKKQQFKQWCEERKLSVTEVIRSMIDYCLDTGEPDFLRAGENPLLGEPNLDIDRIVTQVLTKVSKSDTEVRERIQRLEEAITQISPNNLEQPNLNLDRVVEELLDTKMMDLCARIQRLEEIMTQTNEHIYSNNLEQPNLNINRLVEELLDTKITEVTVRIQRLEEVMTQTNERIYSNNLEQPNLDVEDVVNQVLVLQDSQKDIKEQDREVSGTFQNVQGQNRDEIMIDYVTQESTRPLHNKIENSDLTNDNDSQGDEFVEETFEASQPHDPEIEDSLESFTSVLGQDSSMIANTNKDEPLLPKLNTTEDLQSQEHPFTDLTEEEKDSDPSTEDNSVELHSVARQFSFEDTVAEIKRVLAKNPNLSANAIASHLEKHGYPTQKGKHQWQRNQVLGILKKYGV